MIRFPGFRLFFLFAWLLVLSAPLCAQNAETQTLAADALKNNKTIQLDKLKWKYHAGDDMGWADLQFDDTAWETLSGTSAPQTEFTKREWHGIGWFRLHVQIDEALAGQRLCLRAWHYGASEIYVDGSLVQTFGNVSDSADKEQEFNPRGIPVPVAFNTGGAHVIAVRYSFANSTNRSTGIGRWLARGGYEPELTLKLTDLDDSILDYAASNQSGTRINALFVGILCALALLHFLLFLFYRRVRANLFYSIYAIAFAAQLLCGNLSVFGHQGSTGALTIFVLIGFTLGLTFVALLAFLYTAFTGGFSRYFWIVFAAWAVATVLRITLLRSNFWVFYAAVLCVTLTIGGMVFTMVKALREKREGAWIVMTGIQLFGLGMFVSLIGEAHLMQLPPVINFFGELATVLSIPLSVSVYLAREVAQTNRNLEAQLAQVTELSARQLKHERTEAELRLQHEQERAENERRAQELEEARQLQLSMLPKAIPQPHGLEIAAYMKPATEVGGDYYDFHTSTDGTLTIALGDATGHGLKAGTMVTAMKSLFETLAAEPDIPRFFQQSNRVLKRMNLRSLFMALTMLKIKGNRMIISAAGMPSTFLYRAGTGSIEELVIRGMPLGSVKDFPYKQQELELAAGDIVVLMSDGFPERFNEAGEMFDYTNVKGVLERVVLESSQSIINHFVQTGDEWAGTRAQDDDVTFVVLKVTNDKTVV